MYWLILLMSLAILGLIVSGVYFEAKPGAAAAGRRWLKPTIGTNIVVIFGAQLGLLALGIHDALAQPEVASAARELSIGEGLAIIGIGIPTGLSTIAAGIAVGPVGAASLAVLAEKPEMFGRTLIYLGLAEGIAIYGLVMSILLLDKI